jgi:hypothetical protein
MSVSVILVGTTDRGKSGAGGVYLVRISLYRPARMCVEVSTESHGQVLHPKLDVAGSR